MFFKSSEYKFHTYFLIAILIGILGFFSTYLITFITTTPDYTFYASCETAQKHVPIYNFPKDSINLVTKDYLHDIASQPSIKLIESNECVTEKGIFYAKSEFIETYFFSSEEKKELTHIISALDYKYAKKLGRKNISSPFFFNKFPKAAAWIILISIATGISFFLVPFFLAGIRIYSEKLSFGMKVQNICFAVLILALLMTSQFLPDYLNAYMLLKPSQFVNYFGFGYSGFALIYGATVSFIGTLFWLILIFTINAKLNFLVKHDRTTLLSDFKNIKQDVESYFIVIAIFLSFSIFCTDSLIRSLNSFIPNELPLYPTEFAFANGMVQTFFLILIYSGIRINFIRVQKLITNDATTSEADKDKVAEDKSFVSYLKVILTMLAPVIGSGIQEIIGLVTGIT